MGEDGPSRRVAPQLAVTIDPLRSAVVDCLVLGPATAVELAQELDVPVERIRYQLKRLRRAGIVSVHAERWRRGAVEHIYVADYRQLVFPEEGAGSHVATRHRRQIPQSLRSIFKEALEATHAGSFHKRDDCGIVRIPVRLDRRGFREVHEIFEAAVRDLFDVRDKSGSRLSRSGGRARAATAVLLLFEMPG